MNKLKRLGLFFRGKTLRLWRFLDAEKYREISWKYFADCGVIFYGKPKYINYDVDFDLPEGTDTMAWYTITQQRDTYNRIELDANGKGAGTYPVWKSTTGEEPVPYYYRIEIVAYELKDGTVLPVKDLLQNQPSIRDTYATDGNVYVTVVQGDA